MGACRALLGRSWPAFSSPAAELASHRHPQACSMAHARLRTPLPWTQCASENLSAVGEVEVQDRRGGDVAPRASSYLHLLFSPARATVANHWQP